MLAAEWRGGVRLKRNEIVKNEILSYYAYEIDKYGMKWINKHKMNEYVKLISWKS